MRYGGGTKSCVNITEDWNCTLSSPIPLKLFCDHTLTLLATLEWSLDGHWVISPLQWATPNQRMHNNSCQTFLCFSSSTTSPAQRSIFLAAIPSGRLALA